MERLGSAGIEAVADYIRQLDPEGRYVRLDIASSAVEYSADFVMHEQIGEFEGEEEVCRAAIVCWLSTKGGYLPNNIEIEKRYSIGRPKVGAELDILVRRADGTPFMLIEVKSPVEYEVDQDKYIKGQLFDIAPLEAGSNILSFSTVTIRGGAIVVVSKTIDHRRFPDFGGWQLSRAHGAEIPSNYGEPTHIHLICGGERDLRSNVSFADLKRIQKRLHDVLWRGSTPDNTIYSYVVKLFLAKTHDEKTTNEGQKYKFQILYPANERESPEETFQNISDLYRVAYKKYMALPDEVEIEGLNDRDFSPEQTAFVVELLQDISLIHAATGSDVLGTFFEGITREGFKQSKGLFFTHGNVVNFIIHVLDIRGLVKAKIKSNRLSTEKLPYIIDPSCGSGTFLLAAMAHITKYVLKEKANLSVNREVRDFVSANFMVGQENNWASTFLYGIDHNETLAVSTKVNMLLRRDGQTHIYHADGLAPLASYTEAKFRGRPSEDSSVYAKPVAANFDVIVSNPPFSITLDPHTLRGLGNSFGLASDANSENLFLERWYQLLKPKGRLGVVLPESFFSTKENLSARLFLFAHFNVKAVVSLPKEAFEPWTPTRTSLLFAEKKTLIEEQIWKNKAVKWETRAVQFKAAGLRASMRIAKAANELCALKLLEEVNAVRELLDRLDQPLTVLDMEEPVDLLLHSSKMWAAAIEEQRKQPYTKETKDALRLYSNSIKGISRRAELISAEAIILPRVNRLLNLGLIQIDLTSPPATLLEVANAYVTALRRLDIRVWAFQKVSNESSGSFELAATDAIGYRRTKRGETERPNELFRACTVPQNPAHEEAKRVLDLELCSLPWEIEDSDPTGFDLLNQLATRISWSNS